MRPGGTAAAVPPGAGPARHIVLFSDGTGNSASSLFKTNVRRLYEALDLTDPANPQHPRQFAFYDDGVGTSGFRPLALLGGALGVGLKRNVLDLYSFLCRTWRPGDHIYGFGFSRGAFTIRVVTGLVMNQGIVPYDGDEEVLRRRVVAAYRAYRRERYHNLDPFVPLLRHLRDAVIAGWERAWGRAPYDQRANRGRPFADAQDRASRPAGDPPAEVAMLGLWDTVDAYGLPIEELTRAVDLLVLPITMPDGDLNPRVLRACHALSLDDERRTFHPRLWNEEPHVEEGRRWGGVEGGNRNTSHIRKERITQVWFAGVHADVGGGYADDSLAHVPLGWMLGEAEACGLRFAAPLRDRLLALADENGPIHDSRRGLAGYYRYQPRDVGLLSDGRPPPWFRFSPVEPLRRRFGRHPVRVPRPKIHESVLRRIATGQDGYAPIGLPAGFAVARFDGSIVAGDDLLRNRGAMRRATTGPAAGVAEDEAIEARPERQGWVWNKVWRRRVVYFATLFTTLGLAAMPLYRPAEPDAACGDLLCLASSVIGGLGSLLPGFAAGWVPSFTAHPDTFAALLLLILLLMWRGRVLERQVGDGMRRAWYAIPGLAPRTGRAAPPPSPPGTLDRAVQWLRNQSWYRRTWRIVAGYALPGLAIVATAYLGVAVLNHVAYAVREAAGGLCRDVPMRRVGAERVAGQEIDIQDACAPTGLKLEAGATYRLLLTIEALPGQQPWHDLSVPAGPNGIRPQEPKGSMWLVTPLRRHLGERWFQLMARIGSDGSDTYAPSWALTEERSLREGSRDVHQQVYEATLTARRDGKLFLYVNDAGIVLNRTWFYDNNYGLIGKVPGRAIVEAKLIGRRHAANDAGS